MADVRALIQSCCSRGLELFVRDGRLGAKPKSLLNAELQAEISEHKEQLITALSTVYSAKDNPLPAADVNAEENDQQALTAACRAACEGVPGITPDQFASLLNANDKREILAGLIPAPTLRAYAKSFAQGIREGRIRVQSSTQATMVPLSARGTAGGNPELRRKVLKQLEDNPETRYAYVVDNPDTDPVIVGFGIRDAATCEIAIPKARFDPVEFLLAIKDMEGTT